MPNVLSPPFRTHSPRRSGALLAALAWLAGCATQPASDGAAIAQWTQLGPHGEVSLRAIVAASNACPTAVVDGVTRPLLPRAKATPLTTARNGATGNPAFDAEFAVNSCELTLPRSARRASLGEQAVALPGADIRRIVVVGDTGCRIKVPAGGTGDPIQDCNDPVDWPWERVAAAAARTRPDLVIHLGDYHYREYCDKPALCGPLREQGVVIDYGWSGWNADFFAPARPLLNAAAWIVVRGNHEDCDRGGEGWMRFLSPVPYQACANQLYKTDSRSVLDNNRTADAYTIDLGGALSAVVVDNAGHEDYRPASKTAHDVAIFKRTLTALQTVPEKHQVWLLLHRPIWYDLLEAPAQPNALQLTLARQLPANVQFAFAGHQHAFQTINFAPEGDTVNYPAGRPAQVVVGASGTQLEAFDPSSPFYQGKSGYGSKEREHPDGRLYDGVVASSGIVLNRYSFLLLERDDAGWAGTVLDPDGTSLRRCRLDGDRKEIACSVHRP
jgi:hypothetical protein